MSSSRAGARPPGFSRFYFLGWGALSTLALAYLTVLAVNPELLAGLTVPAGAQMRADGEAARPARSPEVQARRQQTLAALRQELDSARQALAAAEQREHELMTRIRTLERAAPARPAAATAEGTPVLPAAVVPPGSIEGRVEEPPPATIASPRPAPAQPQSTVVPGLVLGPPPAAMQQPGGPAPAAAPSATAPGQPQAYGVLLARGASVDALRLSWLLLNDRHKTLLKDLDARFLLQPAKSDAPYHLLAGPFASAEKATQVCTQLKAKKATCTVTAFAGEQL